MRSSLPSEQTNRLEKLKETQEQLSNEWTDYWFDYSAFDTWQFWLNVAFVIIPLILIYFFIDRKKIFLLGFFGFNIHVWSAYLDATVTRANYIEYPYNAVPFTPIQFGMDTSLIPVLFMLLYQWSLNKGKNFYLYALLLIAGISFIVKPLCSAHHLMHLKQGANYIHIFVAYIVITLVSILITNLFRYLHNKEKRTA
ncbi:CBO0543 family protein [Metabacillus fastidiosus]|uniref:CBO0543 family protein n=1 Tax=Metabacillus fastidiosus TaxID=1458 RepID=UPI002DBF39FF|nr:CBO0543 family protein [Metabacillus fastidiosus]MEC2078388.1 hypothetical protein [Metabacillus fastidiosus]